MDLLLSALALLLALAAGFGLTLLLAPRHRAMPAVEIAGLSILFGTAFVSLSLFLFGLVFSEPLLRWLVAVACVVLVVVAWFIKRRQVIIEWPVRLHNGVIIFSAVLLIQIGAVVWFAFHSDLGWDGLIIWQYKAHQAFLNHGALPGHYFTDLSQQWTHHEYPLYLPYTEAWFCFWAGHDDQGLAKIVVVLVYLAALGLLYTGAARLGGSKWKGFLAASLLFFVPSAIFYGGGSTSGYADFPVAVFYLGAVMYMAEYMESGAKGALRLCSTFAALAIWVKNEGVILWLIVAALICIRALWKRDWRAALRIILPGAFMAVGWKAFLYLVRMPPWNLFMPMTPANLWANLGRLTKTLPWLATELINWQNWSLLWPLMLLALLYLGKDLRRGKYISLVLSILLPLLLYSGIYIFTNMELMLHVTNSMPRLMIAPALVAVLLISLAVPVGRTEPAAVPDVSEVADPVAA